MRIDTLGDWKRTHDCGSLRSEDISREVVLMGWVNRRRDLGKLIFIDLRDRSGLTQIVFDKEFDEASHDKATALRAEFVIAVKGEVIPRLEGQENLDLPTGMIEVRVNGLKILNETEVPPFQVDGKIDASENLRLKYRYLDLRRPFLFQNLFLRHKIALEIRNYLSQQGFLEVETPILTKSTPEGARDYLVPSRISRGRFYALPQSPQLFKQLLMVAGFDRYFQIVKCFRDEDLRADRQPEFTQVDLELSFADENRVMEVFEGLMVDVFSKILGRSIVTPFPRIEYSQAIALYGTDRPDVRFGMELADITHLLKSTSFKAFANVIGEGGVVKAINVKKGGISLSRKEIERLTSVVREAGAKGLLWAKVTSEGWQSTLAKFLDIETMKAVEKHMKAEDGDLLFFVADSLKVASAALGFLRLEIGKKLGLIKDGTYEFIWVTKFPLFEYDKEEGRYVSVHHPFTSPLEAEIVLLTDRPDVVKSRAYDLVINGEEIGGGSVRIHTMKLQNEIFRVLKLSKEEVEQKFGFFLDALKYGAPPHAGMALGFDRLVALMVGAESLRDVIAFPKTQRATCPVTDAPSEVNEGQLAELALSVIYS